MIKRFCDICEIELVYHTWNLNLKSLPNASRLEISRELCFDCAERIRIAIDIAEKNLKIMDIETI